MKSKAYNWNEIPGEVVRRGVSRKAFRGRNVMLVMNELHPGMDLNPHTHTFEQVVYIVSGRAIYHVGDVPHDVGPGSLLIVPPGVPHYIEPIADEPVLNLDIFAPPRADYLHLVRYQEESQEDSNS